MRAGQLRHYITIQEKTQVKDSMGSLTTTWSNLVSTWAGINTLKSTEKEEYSKLEEETIYQIKIRYYDGLDSSMRISFGSRVFKILGIANFQERNIFLEMTCKEQI